MSNDVVKLIIGWLGLTATGSLGLICWGLFTIHSMAVDIGSIKTLMVNITAAQTEHNARMVVLERRITEVEQLARENRVYLKEMKTK